MQEIVSHLAVKKIEVVLYDLKFSVIPNSKHCCSFAICILGSAALYLTIESQ